MSISKPNAERGADEWAPETDADDGSTRRATERRAVLVCRRGETTQIIELREGEEASFGRGASTLVIDSPRASRRHARVRLKNGAVIVEDLGSRNGTVIDGETLRGASKTIPSGSVVDIGDCRVMVVLEGGPSAVDDGATDDEVSLATLDGSMAEALAHAKRAARMPTTVLVLGETGVGKDVMAQRIHRWSKREGPFVRVHCAAIPDNLLESELFGHERGAFTGADRRKIGYIEAANSGTLFIDEIGELSASAQVKLLTVLENRSVTRIGATRGAPVDIRVVCATNRDLASEAQSGKFRADLYYRISAFVLRVPPLRERPREIRTLAETFVRELATLAGEAVPRVSEEFIDALGRYPWPGNVRELRNTIEHALVVADGASLSSRHLPANLGSAGVSPPTTMRSELNGLERARIEAALAAEGGNQTRAAEKLGMSRRTLVYKLARWRKEG